MANATDRFPPRFVFHGNAVAAAAYITRMGQERVSRVSPVHGQSSLPVIGGHSESTVAGSIREFTDVFEYGECRTMADGKILPREIAVTDVSASVKGVRVTNRPTAEERKDPRPIVFRAATLALAMRSTHPRRGDPQIEFVGRPKFEGLSLDDRKIELQLHEDLLKPSMKDLNRRFKSEKRFFQTFRDLFMRARADRPPLFGQSIPRMNRYCLCSFVRSIRWGKEEIDGHVLTVPGFGSIYFGEMLMNREERRVTLVRMELGSQVGARAAFAENNPNGSWWPPG